MKIGFNTPRFASDERGQAILFAAASVMVLAGFIALVFNIGQLTSRRVETQLAADSAVYSGAMVQANSLSTIAWINDGMAQVQTNLTRYAVDVCTTGVVAELEQRLSQQGLGTKQYGYAVKQAREWLPRGKEWLIDLSRIQNAVALVTPRLMQETMYDVARANGAERISIHPANRLFPRQGGSRHFRIEQFGNGWRITNLDPDSGEMLWLFKSEQEWHVVYSKSGVIVQEVVIIEVEPDKRWVIQERDGAGKLIREMTIIKTDELGWIITGTDPQGDPTVPGVKFTFTPVDMDGDGTKEGTRIQDAHGNWQVFKREGGDLFLWDKQRSKYVSMTTQTTTIGGIPVKVNVTNTINFPGGSIDVGTPTRVRMGHATIVLSDPPSIETSLGPVAISVRGFDAESFSVSVGGFAVNVGSADGRWRKYYDPDQELWWRHRLTEQPRIDPRALAQWQYDYELIGALLRAESNNSRYLMENGLRARLGQAPLPAWTKWFDITTGRPYQPAYSQSLQSGTRLEDPPANAYYRTLLCTVCNGTGRAGREACAVCNAHDHDWDGKSDVRIFLADAAASSDLAVLRGGDTETYMEVRVYDDNSYGIPGRPDAPLVLSEEFFKYGLSVAAWRGSETAPMIFNKEPDWGFVAVSSARVGVPLDSAGGGLAYVYQFAVPGGFDTLGRDAREQWVEDAPENLYRPSLEVKLFSSRRNVDVYDLEHDVVDVRPTAENGVTYLWDALMFAGYTRYDEPSTWLSDYDGRTDRDIPRKLSLMRNSRGAIFDARNPEIENLIFH